MFTLPPQLLLLLRLVRTWVKSLNVKEKLLCFSGHKGPFLLSLSICSLLKRKSEPCADQDDTYKKVLPEDVCWPSVKYLLRLCSVMCKFCHLLSCRHLMRFCAVISPCVVEKTPALYLLDTLRLRLQDGWAGGTVDNAGKNILSSAQNVHHFSWCLCASLNQTIDWKYSMLPEIPHL